ncbi:hypothetical protein EW146_g8909 [Bondarzewia mesenterica]|uniref:Uncharacterized protein n=1 Tax=Bondarzewia mesenterica TaxID=1095465 RepID=A0A4S4LFX7_9AGAM|nr:hypothetical protein EW146_g8909 [Bondarzewia mesenterica]
MHTTLHTTADSDAYASALPSPVSTTAVPVPTSFPPTCLHLPFYQPVYAPPPVEISIYTIYTLDDCWLHRSVFISFSVIIP